MPVSLSEFSAHIRQALDLFEVEWVDSHQAEPEHWPMEMPSLEDWIEQLLVTWGDT